MAASELISKILSCYAEIEDYSQELRPELEERLKITRDQRRALVRAAREQGLRIKDCNYHHAIEDLFDTDDTGKLVDTTFKVKVQTLAEVCAAVNFCREHKMLAMPIGARTSALGVFEARPFADREGLRGVLGIEFENIFYDGDQSKGRDCLLQIPEFSSDDYELIVDACGALALLKAKNATNSHRVFAYAGSHIVDVNNFINQHLVSDRFSYRIMPDPTSWAEAQIGGIIATGAEGGNRTKASEDLRSLVVVDANSQSRFLDRAAAINVVGLNGNAGIIYQAEFEVTAFPKYEQGIFIALKGRGLAGWKDLLQLQHQLKPFARSVDKNTRCQVGPDTTGIIVTSIEPLSTMALELACGENSDEFERKLKRLAAHGDFVVFVTYNSFFNAESGEIYESKFFTDILGLQLETAEFDADENFLVKHENIAALRLLSDQELKRMDQVRHEAPSHARELAKRMGGVTASTDLNIRFESASEAESQAAFEKVAELYHQYSSSFTKADGFTVVVYGHLHPGVGSGGGIDPHVRVIFELSNPGSRYNAPEQVQLLKKKQSQLYKQLLALDGQLGIRIFSPEKSRFTNTEYWSWLCLKYSSEARNYLQTIADLGTADVGGEFLPIIGARVPHSLPGIFQPRGSVKALLSPDYLDEQLVFNERNNALNLDPVLAPYLRAVLDLCQSSHRGGKIRRMLRFVLENISQRLALSEQQYVFFIEDLAEASEIIARNFPQNAPKVETIILNSLEDLRPGICSQAETCYGISLDQLGIPSTLALLVVPHSAIWQVYQDQIAGKAPAAFRNLYELWSSAPFETMETPNLPAIACLGLLLERDSLSNIKAGGKKGASLCLVPGPSQLAPALLEDSAAIWQKTTFDSGEQQKIIGQLKDFIGLPDNHELAFYASATQCMQVLADAIAACDKNLNLIQIVNDAFGERLASILGKTKKDLTKIFTPWTTSENSQLETVCEQIAASIKPADQTNNLIFITPHKTATTADVLPDHLIAALGKRGLLIGRDYHLIVDITSGIGARAYATLLAPDTGKKRLPFSGFFCGAQKAFGLPAGLAFVGLSPVLMQLLAPEEKSEAYSLSLAARFKTARAGHADQKFQLYLLGLKLASELAQSRTIDQIELECRARMDLLLGWIERHPDLMALVPNSNDRSPLILGIFSQAKNLQIAKRLMSDIFNIQLGSGYGPFEREAIRLYLANITYDQLKYVLAALDLVLELDDVVHTRGEKVPNIALREPHDPLAVIARVAENCTVDGLIKDQLGLEWLGRLVKTYNANVISTPQKMRLGGKIPWSSVGHQEKARIYGEQKNLSEMCKILGLRNEDTKLDILYHFQLFKETETHLRNRVLSNPRATWGDDSFSATVRDLLVRAERHLDQIKHLLNKYVSGTGDAVNPLDGSRMQVKAARDSQNRVEWPIVA